jgi:MFS family permease
MDPAGEAAPRWSTLLQGGRRGTLAVLSLGIWLHAADSVMVATVLPSMVAEIGGLAWAGWPFVLYGLGSILASATAALLAERRGLGPGMALAAGLYATGTVLSATAPVMAQVLVGSRLQGVGGGWMSALAFIGATRLFPAAQWPLVLALLSGTWGVSALCGPLVGGLFAEHATWRAAYWAFGAQAVALALTSLKLAEGASAGDEAPAGSVPVGRLAVLGAGVLAIAWAGIDPVPVRALPSIAAGLALIALFLVREQRAENPMLPPRPLDLGRPVGAGLAMVASLAFATISLTAYGPFLMQHLHGASPLVAGYVVASESVAWTLAAILVARATTRAEPWLIIGGGLLIAFGVAGFAWAMPRGPLPALLPFAVLQGAGFGFSWTFIVRRVVGSVPEAEQARATAAMPTVQLLGYSLGAAVAGMVANTGGLSETAPRETLQHVAFWLFAVFVPVALAGCAAAVTLVRRST